MTETDTDLIIEGSLATWNMGNIRGDLGGTYTGTFQFRCYMTPVQQIAANRKYRDMLGPNAVLASEHDGYLAYALTQLEKRIVKAPPFWHTPLQNGEMAGSIPDKNVILIILDAAVMAETLYKERMLKDRDTILKKTIAKTEEMLQTESGEDE